MILFCGAFQDPDPARAAEYREALQRNCACDWIEKIHLYVEEDPAAFDRHAEGHAEYRHVKVSRVPVGVRMTFADYFAEAARAEPGRTCIVANADIAFDVTLARLCGINLDNTLVCLSRTEPDGGEPEWTPGQRWADNSQDAWIFRAPLRPFRCDWRLGTEGCDNVLADEAVRAGLRTLNPWHDIKAWHVHVTGLRRTRTRRDGAPTGDHRTVPRCRIPVDCAAFSF